MTYKTQPTEPLTRRSALHWEDTDNDLVILPDFLKLGLIINWTQVEALAFKERLEKDPKFGSEIDQLYHAGKIMVLRAPELQSYFLTGSLVKEYQLLARAVKDYQDWRGLTTKNELGIHVIQPEHLAEARPRFDELLSTFYRVVGFQIFLDAQSLVSNQRSKIHSLFLAKNK